MQRERVDSLAPWSPGEGAPDVRRPRRQAGRDGRPQRKAGDDGGDRDDHREHDAER
jgi:hypothetical protein